jgi:cytochrome c-type biogenesis protein CcmE
VLDGSVRRDGPVLYFRIRDPKLRVSVPVRYTGVIPDPFAQGRAVLVTVSRGRTSTFVGQPNSLTTKCPSKYQAAAASY